MHEDDTSESNKNQFHTLLTTPATLKMPLSGHVNQTLGSGAESPEQDMLLSLKQQERASPKVNSEVSQLYIKWSFKIEAHYRRKYVFEMMKTRVQIIGSIKSTEVQILLSACRRAR